MIPFTFALLLANTATASVLDLLAGQIPDSTHTIEEVESFNSQNVYHVITSILSMDYFKFYKVNMDMKCLFWPDDGRCVLKDCHVLPCPKESLPSILMGEEQNLEEIEDSANCHDELGNINSNLSIQDESIYGWTKYDALLDFCEVDEEDSSQSVYVDLLLNPERYTGYKGKSAQRVWSSIYEENCFGSHKSTKVLKTIEDACLEERIFYRILSGLHSSISIHLCASFPYEKKFSFLKHDYSWDVNLDEFNKRFNLKRYPQSSTWLKNLYFVYLFELRAIVKAGNILSKKIFYTGNEKEDQELQALVTRFLKALRKFPNPFNEEHKLKLNTVQGMQMKYEIREHFKNITRIMNCVGCDKCKLWGKLQTHALGTAFTIIFHEESILEKALELRRNDVVALLNGFGRLSSSIHNLIYFRSLLSESTSR